MDTTTWPTDGYAPDLDDGYTRATDDRTACCGATTTISIATAEDVANGGTIVCRACYRQVG